jgi:hypothetical protein
MSTVLEAVKMARPRGRPESGRNDVPAKIDKSVVEMGKAIARYKGISLAEFLSDILEGPVSKEYAKMLREIDARNSEKN